MPAAPGPGPDIQIVQEYRARVAAAVACAAVASLLDITLNLSAGWYKLLVSALSLAGLTIAGWAWLTLTTATRSAWASYAGVSPRSAIARGWPQVLQDPESPLGWTRAAGGMRALLWLGHVPALEASYLETVARYGAGAGGHSMRSRQAAYASRAIGWGVTIFWLGYVNLYFALQTWPGLLTFLVLAALAESVAVMCGVAARQEAAWQVQAMIEVTGARDLTDLGIPWRPSQYVAWCQARKLEPYPLGRPELTEADRLVV